MPKATTRPRFAGGGIAADLSIKAVAIPELGNSCYVIASNGEAAVVDPPRCTADLVRVARDRGAEITAVLETHVHNDFVSGSLELAARTGATIVAPARGAYRFGHRPMAEGDELAIGSMRIVAIETPGHTDEHLAYLVWPLGHDEAAAVLTGGSLLVGNAGRSDLLGSGHTERLEREQFRSIRRLMSLPDHARVLPTHGAGSFCVALGAESWKRTSTIGDERATNPLARARNEREFLTVRGRGLLPVPAYFRATASRNRAGVSGDPSFAPLPPLSADQIEEQRRAGAVVVDARDRFAFCHEHLPGSIGVELDESFPSRLGSVLDPAESIVLVLDDPATQWERAITFLARIGAERVLGFLDGGVEAWAASGRPVSGLDAATPAELAEVLEGADPPLVLDVRMPLEWLESALPGDAVQIHIGDLPLRMGELPRHREIWTVCSAGRRATIAASLLAARGFRVRPVADGGSLELLDIAAGLAP